MQPDAGIEPNTAIVGMSPIERWALVYLAVPVVIFCSTWFTPIVGFLSAGAAGGALASRVRSDWLGVMPRVPARSSRGPSLGFVCFLLAMAWAAFGGAGHWLHANIFDWLGRDAILRDMVVESWPIKVTDPSADGDQFWYRGPLAYYVVPALLGKLFGLRTADFFLYLWTAGGVAVFLALALERIRGVPRRLAAFVVIVFFSGADTIGILMQGGSTQIISESHLEWWASSYQFSSNSTLLFWVPNHALPGWIAGAWLLRQWGSATSIRWSAWICAITVLWSPMVAVGLAVMILINALFFWKLEPAFKLSVAVGLPNLCGLVFGIVCSLYISADAGTIAQGFRLPVPPQKLLGNDWTHAVIFGALEAGLLTIAAMSKRSIEPLLACTAMFMLCLSYTFGLGNDWAMRGSVVPLCVLCLVITHQLLGPDAAFRRGGVGRLRVLVLVALLSVGFVTPAHEFIRAIRGVPWAANLERGLLAHAGSAASYAHYFASVNHPMLRAMMRD